MSLRNSKIPKLEIWVSDRYIRLEYDYHAYLWVGVNEQGEFVVHVQRPDETRLTDHVPVMGMKKIDVDIVTKQEQGEQTSMAQPKMAYARAANRQIRAARAVKQTSTNNEDQIDEHGRDNVLNDLLDSMLDNPVQSNAFRRSETARIAEARGQGVMAVAGVRANLTRGTYGDLEKLLRSRKRQRVAAAKH